MIPVLLILVPFIGGLLTFFLKKEGMARSWALLASLSTLAISIVGLTLVKDATMLQADAEWIPALGTRFTVSLDGMGQLLCLLTALALALAAGAAR